jgi:hypothetical protein
MARLATSYCQGQPSLLPAGPGHHQGSQCNEATMVTTHEQDIKTYDLLCLLFQLKVIDEETFISFDLYGLLEVKQKLNHLKISHTGSNLSSLIRLISVK